MRRRFMAVSDGAQQLVVFSLGHDEYALPIAQVQEIIRYTEPRPVASEEPWIEGVIGLRGKIIRVCNLARRLGVVAERADDARIVIVETAGGTAGLVVDEVEGVVRAGDRLVVLLNADGIFAGGSVVASAV